MFLDVDVFWISHVSEIGEEALAKRSTVLELAAILLQKSRTLGEAWKFSP